MMYIKSTVKYTNQGIEYYAESIEHLYDQLDGKDHKQERCHGFRPKDLSVCKGIVTAR